MRTIIAGSLLAIGVAACNPVGTCIPPEKADSELGPECIANFTKRACASRNDSPQFYPESAAAGIVRCKSLGYDETYGQKPDPKSVTIYYKKPKK